MNLNHEPAPVACNLNAMTQAQRERHIVVLNQLRKLVEQISELPDGYAFIYPVEAGLFMAAAEFVTLESLCCSFFKFRLEFERGNGSFTLTLSGPPESKPIMLAALRGKTG